MTWQEVADHAIEMLGGTAMVWAAAWVVVRIYQSVNARKALR